jgi:hypothetical protein
MSMRKSDVFQEPDMQHQSEMVQTEAGLLVPAGLRVGGRFLGQILRKGKVIDEFECPNLVTNEGLNHILNVAFNGATPVSPWYLGIFEGNYTPVAGVTAATITAASTECTAYVAATRQEYVEVASTAQTITNAASRASFVFNATKTIYGAFLASNSAKSATTGTLFAAARFGSAKAVTTDDELLLTYAFTAASA